MCVRWLMFTFEWPADNNLCPGRYYRLPWHCNIRLKQVQGLVGQIVLKQREPYGAVMHFTGCNDQKQTCFAPLCTTALYFSSNRASLALGCSLNTFDSKMLRFDFFFNCNFIENGTRLGGLCGIGYVNTQKCWMWLEKTKRSLKSHNCILHGQKWLP